MCLKKRPLSSYFTLINLSAAVISLFAIEALGSEMSDKVTAPNPTVESAQAAVEAIEEDDEFEEFEPAHWAAGEEVAEDTQQWQDNWDAEDMDDDFTKNLREELLKSSGN